MNRRELTAVQEDSTREGDSLSPRHFAPCDQCGNLVSLDYEITVSLNEPDGSKVETRMEEWQARDLLDELGVPRPPVICAEHSDLGPITTERLP